MGNHMACLSPPPPALNRLQNPSSDCVLIKFLHCDTGAVSELEGPLTAAEVMLDFPAQFLCCLSNAAALTSCGRRISAVPADEDLQAAELYLLLPMHRLNSRFSLEEMAFLATLIKAVHTSYINVGSKHVPANRANSQRKVAPFPASFSESMQRTSCESYTSVMRSLPFKPLMEGCTKLQHNKEPASEFNTMPGLAKHALCKSKSWMPKLETVQEHAVAS